MHVLYSTKWAHVATSDVGEVYIDTRDNPVIPVEEAVKIAEAINTAAGLSYNVMLTKFRREDWS